METAHEIVDVDVDVEYRIRTARDQPCDFKVLRQLPQGVRFRPNELFVVKSCKQKAFPLDSQPPTI